MSLEGLLSVGEIGHLTCSAGEIAGLIAKAERKLNDAKAENISKETRLEQAYTVIFTCASIALRAMNYRVLNSSGKHYLTIETTRYTLGLENETVEYLQTIRNMRNQEIYGIALQINADDLNQLITEAGSILESTKSWLADKYPTLLA